MRTLAVFLLITIISCSKDSPSTNTVENPRILIHFQCQHLMAEALIMTIQTEGVF
jgi:hypothetical protein